MSETVQRAFVMVWDGMRPDLISPELTPNLWALAEGGVRFPAEQLASGGRCSVYAVDQTGSMRVAEVRLPTPKPQIPKAQDAPPAAAAAPEAFR